jgi:hypothetical protein
MAIIVKRTWKDVTLADYEKARQLVAWEANPAAGLIFHAASYAKGELSVLEVWENENALNKYVKDRLLPVVKGQMKIASDPKTEILPAIAYFKPVSPNDCDTYDKTTHSFTH